MFRPDRPSSGVQVVVMKESAAHSNAVLLSLRNCLQLILGFLGYVMLELYFKVHMYIRADHSDRAV
jgi:hypothetical protein